MLLAHEQLVYNAPSPWWNIIAAGLAAVFATLGWYFVHKNSKSRDLLNWQRSVVADATTKILELSKERQKVVRVVNGVINENGRMVQSVDLFNDINSEVNRLTISAYGSFIEAEAKKLRNVHTVSIAAIMLTGPNPDPTKLTKTEIETNISMIDIDFVVKHQALIDAARKTLGMKPKQKLS